MLHATSSLVTWPRPVHRWPPLAVGLLVLCAWASLAHAQAEPTGSMPEPAPTLVDGVDIADVDPPPALDIRLRTQAHRIAQPSDEAAAIAKALLPFAILATEAYCNLNSKADASAANVPRDDDCPSSDLHQTAGWKKLSDYPSAHAEDGVRLPVGGHHRGLRLSAYVMDLGADTPPLLAFAFRGTEFSSWMDWHTNLRWLLPGRDQYDILADHVPLLLRDAKQRAQEALGRQVRQWQVVTTGHSLGGGLAQLMAYKSHEVGAAIVFDSSPVTGHHQCVGDDEVNCNVRIWRAYARGEVLSYVRAALRLTYPLSDNITEIEIGNIRGNFLARHSMVSFLAEISRVHHVTTEDKGWTTARLLAPAPDCDCMAQRNASRSAQWTAQCRDRWAAMGHDPDRLDQASQPVGQSLVSAR
ncbi:MAG: hypothetical protein CFE45_17120 [Burkholderiales bacterium PBB5]|nr:MAG: hypothetical protein CFE45_17120 [Burkholderiales bacterium PBB5]